jgi:hypothetical protein
VPPVNDRADHSEALASSGFVDSIAARLLDLLVDMTTVEHLLQGICELAVEAVPDCESASITLIRRAGPVTAAASDQRARTIDEAQYSDGDGPALRAARMDADILVDLDVLDLAAQIQVTDDGVRAAPTWRQLGRNAGISSVVSMPIPATAELRAGLNLYTGRRRGWRPESLSIADALVTYAGDAITIGQRLENRSERDSEAHDIRGGARQPGS